MKLTEEELEGLLKSIELEAPSMSFTRGVMDQVKLQAQPMSLKTRVDKRVIYSIAAAFMLAIVGFFWYVAANNNLEFTMADTDFRMDFSLEKPMYAMLLKVILFIDLVIALIYFDRFLRRKQV